MFKHLLKITVQFDLIVNTDVHCKIKVHENFRGMTENFIYVANNVLNRINIIMQKICHRIDAILMWVYHNEATLLSAAYTPCLIVKSFNFFRSVFPTSVSVSPARCTEKNSIYCTSQDSVTKLELDKKSSKKYAI